MHAPSDHLPFLPSNQKSKNGQNEGRTPHLKRPASRTRKSVDAGDSYLRESSSPCHVSQPAATNSDMRVIGKPCASQASQISSRQLSGRGACWLSPSVACRHKPNCLPVKCGMAATVHATHGWHAALCFAPACLACANVYGAHRPPCALMPLPPPGPAARHTAHAQSASPARARIVKAGAMVNSTGRTVG